MNSATLKIKSSIRFIISFVYAALLTSVPMVGIMDRDNYLTFAEFSPIIMARQFSEGILSFFANEPVWLGVNSVLGIFFEPEIVVGIIIFFSAFTVSFLVLKHSKDNILLLLLVLVMPLVIKNFIVHLRQGLAISFFILGWFAASRNKKLFFYGLTPFIHSSFFLVLPLLILARVLLRLRLAFELRSLAYILFGISISIGIGVLAALLGARQADTTVNMEQTISGVGFIMWLLIASLFLLQGKRFSRKYIVESGVLLFYLATYFLTPITGRLFESSVVIVLLAGLKLSSYRKYSYILIVFLFTLAFFLLRLQQPFLGYGALELG